MKKLIRVVLGLTLLGGLLAFAPTAQAHDDPTVCAVDGQVTLTPPVTNDGAGSGGTFEFTSTTITCVGAHGGTYQVDANGTRRSETCAQAEGTGTLSGSGGSSTLTDGQFSYTRTGTLVLVTGTLKVDGVVHGFSSQLNFLAHPGQVCPVTGVWSADLIGTATIAV
jgi:hypothetical protein